MSRRDFNWETDPKAWLRGERVGEQVTITDYVSPTLQMRFLWPNALGRRMILSLSGSQNSPLEEFMSLVHHPDRSHDLSLIGLVLVIFAIIAAAVPCLKLAVDQAWSLLW